MLLKIKSTLRSPLWFNDVGERERKEKKKIDSLEIDTWNNKRQTMDRDTRSLFFLEIKSIGILDVLRATKPTYRRFNFHLVHRHTHTHTDIGPKKENKK